MEAQYIRQSLIDLAVQQVGSHYLWGGRGEIPGRGTGSFLPPRAVVMAADVFDPQAPCVRCARHADFGATCAGRWGRVLGGAPFSANDPQLRTYLDSQKGRPPGTVDSLGACTPRKVLGGYYSDAPLVWGEACDGKRHFDCVGLINWLLSLKYQMPFTWEIRNYRLNYTQALFTLVAEQFDPGHTAVAPGDIACKDNEHIGFIISSTEMVESMDARNGVVRSPLDGRVANWTVVRPR